MKTGFGFFIVLGLGCIFFSCEGKICPPFDGSSQTVAPGSTGRIMWSFSDEIKSFSYRLWGFTPSDGQPQVRLAIIIGDGDVQILTTSYEVAVEKPATLVLKNVNLTYNGTYELFLSSSACSAKIILYIAVSPSVTLNCSSPVILDEGDDITCICRGQGGNPPADVTWYKDDRKIVGAGKEQKVLTLNHVDRTANGTYKCVAQSHNLTDEKFIEIIVYFAVPPTLMSFTSTPGSAVPDCSHAGSYKCIATNHIGKSSKIFSLSATAKRTTNAPITNKSKTVAVPPTVISFTSTPESAVFDEVVVLTCEAIAVPIPSYIIIHNNTEIVSTQKTYVITRLDYSHAGSYKCIATNHLGNSSKSFSLSTTEKATSEECNDGGTEWYVVVGSMLSGIIIGLFFAYILLCSRRRWFTNRKSEQPVEPENTEVTTTYEELDLTNMNTQDNYQSLRVDTAIDNVTTEDNLNYTTLGQTRDVENNYQSLT